MKEIMIKREIAFVLKRFLPNKQKTSVLARTQGKINLVIKKKDVCSKLWPGMIICFLAQEQTHNHLCDDVEIIKTPTFQSKEDLQWLHHLLELCYFFTPLHNPHEELFNYLYNYLTIVENKALFKNNIKLLQKLSIIHILHSTGFYKEGFKLDNFFKSVSTLFAHKEKERCLKEINNLLHSINHYQIKEMNNYIERGIKSHPCYKQFKTIDFPRII